MTIRLTHEYLEGAYRAFNEDVLRWIPKADLRLLRRDQILLESLVRTRGLRYVTIDLPDACKAFERCLANGRLIPINVPGFGMSRHHGRKDLRPKLFWTLWSGVFSKSGFLKENPCTNSIFLLRQALRMFVKFKEECADEYLYSAVRDFHGIEQELPEPSLDWETPFDSYSHSHSLHLRDFSHDSSYLEWDQSGASGWNGWRGRADFYQRVFDLLAAVMPELDIYALRGRHGPGAVSDGKGTRSKYEFPIWPDKLESLFPFDWFGSSKLCFDELFPSSGLVFSKLVAVPKTAKGPRLIACEPIANQWIQQALLSYFSSAFKSELISGCIDMRDQGKSQSMAKIASNGSLATIDLKSASDRLTCRLVERVFRRRPDILSAMMACRTPLLRQTLDKSVPTWIELKKFATQGSALTFPTQSFVFFSICVASTLFQRDLAPTIENIRKIKKEVVVYGDDLIIPSDAYRELVDALHQLGLKVNETKSFGVGYFRESCGSDWYKEENVTPNYILSDFDPDRPSTIVSMIEVSNNFHKSGLWSLADYLMHRVDYRYLKNIAVTNGALAIDGLYSFCGTKIDHLRMKYDPHTMSNRYRMICLTAKRQGNRPDGVLRLRQYFTERPVPYEVWNPLAYARQTQSIKFLWKSIYTKSVDILPLLFGREEG